MAVTKPLIDPKLKFYDKSHTYKVGRKKLRGVTTWVKSFFPKFDEKKMAKFVVLARRKKGIKTTVREVLKEWKAIAELGTETHKQIEQYINGELDTMAIIDMNSKASFGAEYVDKLRQQYRGAQLLPELRIFSEELELAGTIDLVVLTKENEAVIVDWKTNRLLRGKIPGGDDKFSDFVEGNLAQYTMQLSTYALILEDYYGIKVTGLKLVHLQDNGAVPMDIPFMREVVEGMLEESAMKDDVQ